MIKVGHNRSTVISAMQPVGCSDLVQRTFDEDQQSAVKHS